jgi:hypothetical protein
MTSTFFSIHELLVFMVIYITFTSLNKIKVRVLSPPHYNLEELLRGAVLPITLINFLRSAVRNPTEAATNGTCITVIYRLEIMTVFVTDVGIVTKL